MYAHTVKAAVQCFKVTIPKTLTEKDKSSFEIVWQRSVTYYYEHENMHYPLYGRQLSEPLRTLFWLWIILCQHVFRNLISAIYSTLKQQLKRGFHLRCWRKAIPYSGWVERACSASYTPLLSLLDSLVVLDGCPHCDESGSILQSNKSQKLWPKRRIIIW